MLDGFALLLFAELAGECLRQVFRLPVPGPVIGMFIVAIGMAMRSRFARAPREPTVPSSIERAADALIGEMGLLFVPAGVGIVAVAPMLRDAWVPLGVALVLSTVLTLVVTGAVMHGFARGDDNRAARAAKCTGTAAHD